MKLVVKNGFLINQSLKYKCSIGFNGLSDNKSEGDGCTPIGTFKINKVLYRPDKIKDCKFLIDSEVIEKLDGWCDDVNSDFYNQKIIFPFESSAEHLYRNDDLYDIVCVIDYNLNPIIKGKGSAIFLHVATDDYLPTQGCIAIKKDELLQVALNLNKDTKITISF
tara:strand:+ start:1151 stop:1645 length:495 start_codon:yes stop_codon:yes gene_type:complete